LLILPNACRRTAEEDGPNLSLISNNTHSLSAKLAASAKMLLFACLLCTCAPQKKTARKIQAHTPTHTCAHACSLSLTCACILSLTLIRTHSGWWGYCCVFELVRCISIPLSHGHTMLFSGPFLGELFASVCLYVCLLCIFVCQPTLFSLIWHTNSLSATYTHTHAHTHVNMYIHGNAYLHITACVSACSCDTHGNAHAHTTKFTNVHLHVYIYK